MRFDEKLHRFQNRIDLNDRAKASALHISLNFHNSDVLNKEKLILIAKEYMERIGFQLQPYLIYQHHDAAHPHLHIVTTNIKRNGARINTFNFARYVSAIARKEIDIKYGLVSGEKQYKAEKPEIPEFAQKVNYGKSETKISITKVLGAVLNKYKYSSLNELNGLLLLFNIFADRGRKYGFIYNKKGLLYCLLDENGKKVGVPIKASSFYMKPTLAFLEKKFQENAEAKLDNKHHLTARLNWINFITSKDLNEFKNGLGKEKISLGMRQNKEGVLCSLIYIDHKIKCVFDSWELEEQYQIKGIIQKYGQPILAPIQKIDLHQELIGANKLKKAEGYGKLIHPYPLTLPRTKPSNISAYVKSNLITRLFLSE
ncbi:MAG: hypothetical protein NVSMB67_18860 [Flavisolibacter sp.]